MKNIARNIIILFCFIGFESFSITSNPSPKNELRTGPVDKTYSLGDTGKAVILDFKASYTSNFTLLEWRTDKDSFIALYVIEQSNDGINYDPIAEVKGKRSTQNYSYSDNSNLLKDSFYRLRMTDSEGNTTYSYEVMVKVNPLNQLRLFPVPVKNILNIKGYFGDANNIEVSITDLNGNKYPVYNLIKLDDDHYTVDFSSYNSNIYVVTISNTGKSAVYRVQKR